MTNLSEGARAALRRAAETPLSYGVRVYSAPGDNGSSRTLVTLGEAHLKLEHASKLGREVLEQFELRGVETFQTRQVFAGRLLGFLIHAPRAILRSLSLGFVKDSSITDAKQLSFGYTVEVERAKSMPLGLHVGSAYLTAFFAVVWTNFVLLALRSVLPEVPPALDAILGVLAMVAVLFEIHFLMLVPAVLLRRFSWSWVLHPAVGILTFRDTLMAEGTIRMLADHPTISSAIVVMGRAHLPGFERELVEKHGFRRIEL